uniref:Amino acid transporter transmembrane domain-containing protein n=2 Tax=Phaeomonas parva TaxID=124430 RepID=A0A7S1UC34_9STRA|mmetsp:Transcript_41139/g.128970  ORF Transcript_41139/g.128970 Transcript_41139/m.128970 type:complete len:262 (+) Transcript_41139:57-842(+)
MSVGVSYVLSLTLAVGAYASFGDDVEGDVLNTFEDDNLGANVARVFLAMTMIFTFPMEHFVVRHTVFALAIESGIFVGGQHRSLLVSSASADSADEKLPEFLKRSSLPESDLSSRSLDEGAAGEGKGGLGALAAAEVRSIRNLLSRSDDYLRGGDGGESGGSASERASRYIPNAYFYGTTVLLWGAATAIAMATNDLGFLLSLVGAMGASVLGFMLPAAVYWKTYQDELTAWQKAGLAGLFLFGTALFFLGITVTAHDAAG